jgi:PilZ domain-containing protein
VSSRIVLIGPLDSLPALQERLDPKADVQTFTDAEALEALDHIIRTKPALVAMQDEFADSSRGQALINRIKDDVVLATVEVRVMGKNPAQNRVAVKRGSPGGSAVVAVAEKLKSALDQKGTRRAARVPIKDGVEVAVDGNTAGLIDLSVVGAQVVSSTVLKPNQRVRVTMENGKVKCAGAVVWAAFEMPKGLPTRYRAGIDWGVTAEAPKVETFAKKNKK